MRPLKIRATNYRGYASLDLDFRGVRSIIFSGQTGSGKSSIVGAMRLALTGENGSGDPNGHIKKGCENCRVEYHFERAGSIYRIIQSDSLKGSRKRTDRQLCVSDGNGGWIPKGGKGIAETNAEIERLIGMTDNELICGPLSLQDRAGLFLDPPELRIEGKVYRGRSARLEVTKKMLGLQQWEQWRVAATQQATKADEQATTLETQVVDVQVKLAEKATIEAALLIAEDAIVSSRSQQETTATQISQAERDIARLEAEIPRARQDLATFADDRQALWGKEKTRAEKQNRADHYQTLLGRRIELEAASAHATALDTTLAERRQQLAAIAAEGKAAAEQVTAADGGRRETGDTVTAAGVKLAAARIRVANQEALEQQCSNLAAARLVREECAERIRLTDGEITARRAELDTIKRDNQDATRRRGEILSDEHGVLVQKAGIEPQIEGHTKRTAVMDIVPCIGVDGLPEQCPLLADARASIGPLETLRQKHEELCAWVRPSLPELASTDTQEGTLRALEIKKSTDQIRLKTLDQQIVTLAPAEAELASLATVAATIPGLEADKKAADQAYAAAVTEETRVLSIRDAKAVSYRAMQEAINSTSAERATMDEAVRLLPQLSHAAAELPGLNAEVITLAAEIGTLTGKLTKERDVSAWLSGAEGALAQFRGDRERWMRELAVARSREQRVIEDAARARQELATLDGLAIEAGTAREEAKGLRAKHATLVMLADAYRQIPIVILENIAVPVLEEEANRFLAKVSQNRMSVRIETQREVKSRETLADGLEISARDWRGERSLDDYSGGQKFELFLAFRVAWTKLQERRSGVGIDCLFVDEGFGSLSEGDLAAVVGALKELQSEFPFLCVISHVAAMRDVFPTRVEVTGGGEDSRAELVLE